MKISDIQKSIADVLRNNSSLLTTSEIAKQAEISYQDCYNALTRLCENNLVEKLDDKTYALTDFGVLEFRIALTQNEKTPVETPKAAPIVLEQIVEDEFDGESFIAEIEKQTVSVEVDVKKKEDLKITEHSLPHQEITNGEKAHSKIDDFETRAITPINEKTVNEIKETVNYDKNTPSYYKGKSMQVFDILDEFLTPEAVNGFYIGNIIKYVVRYRGKAGLADLLKARDYLDKLIEATA